MSGKAALRRNALTPLARKYDSAAACARKIKYDSWADAERIADVHAQRDRTLVLAYACDWCDGWHNAKPSSWMLAPPNDPVRSEGMRLLRGEVART